MGELSDQAARDRAATGIDRNLVVTAGAGTGKTTLLVDRLVHLLVREPAPIGISEIVALTFTNKAANEMKLRLRERLNDLLGRPLGGAGRKDSTQASLNVERRAQLCQRYALTTEGLQARARQALGELDRSQIGTIHSFAAHLLRLYPIESGVDPAFQEDDGSFFEGHFNREWRRWLEAELDGTGPRCESWRNVLRLVRLADLKTLARLLADELVPLEALGPRPGHARDRAIDAWLMETARLARGFREAASQPRRLEQMLDAAIPVLERAAGRLGEAGPPSVDMALLDREVPPRTKGWSAETYRQAKRIVRTAQALNRMETHGHHAALRLILELLSPFLIICRDRYVQQGYVSFSGLLARARNLLRDWPGVRRAIKAQYRSILIDEFQDTDPVQYELVLFLAEADDHESPAWHQVRLAPGKLFIVGDPKQSIYAFRGADMEAYDTVVEDCVIGQHPPGERHVLRTNFRTHAALLRTINACFARVFPEEGMKGLQPKHEPLNPSTAQPPALPDERLEVRLVKPDGPDADAEAASRVEAEELARWLSHEVLDRQLIHDGKGHGNAPTRIQPRHVAVLFRTLTGAWTYLEAFRRYHIPHVIDGEKHFYQRQEVIDLINLLRAAANPHDRAALVAVLRSSLGGVADADLAVMAQQSLLDYRRPATGPAGPVAPLYALLHRLYRVLPRLPVSQVVDAVFARAPVLELAAASLDGEQAMANLFKLREVVQELASRSDATFHRVVDTLTARMIDPPDEGERPLIEESNDESESPGAIRILSIHKAKGLEFPVVILAGLHRGADRGDSPAARYDWPSGILGVRVAHLRSLGSVCLDHKHQDRQWAEQRRLLYVGMTRARRRLVVSAGLPSTGSRDGTLLRLVGEGLGQDFSLLTQAPAAFNLQPGNGSPEVPVTVVPGVEGTPASRSRDDQRRNQRQEDRDDTVPAFFRRWSERRARHEAAVKTTVTSPSSHATRTFDVRRSTFDDNREPRTSNIQPRTSNLERKDRLQEKGRLVGTLAHRILEGWDFQADPSWIHERIATACREGRLSGWESHVPAIVTELEDLFAVFFASGVYADLQHATILGREVPFACPWTPAPDGLPILMEGVIDLVYRLDERLWIADYKSDHLIPSEAEARAEGYRDQLHAYRLALEQGLKEEIAGCQVIFLRTGQAVQI